VRAHRAPGSSGKAQPICPKVYNWPPRADSESIAQYPQHLCHLRGRLCMAWLQEQGGVEAIAEINKKKAAML
jgi:phosphoserine aminotransferase